MLTPFGVALRKIRLDRDLKLLDLAEKLGKTSSFISAVETGTKSIPDNYVESIVNALNLSPGEAKELRKAADQTKTVVNVDGLTGSNRELVAAFARQLDSIDEESLEEMKKKFLQSIDGEVPFQRKRRGIAVNAASVKSIREFANKVRSTFLKDSRIDFPIIDILEFALPKIFKDFHLIIADHHTMGKDEGRVVAGKDWIMLREDVYEGACRGDGRSRFTACHELGHYFLHRNVVLARTRDESEPIYRDSEWQADTFAGALLMSTRHLSEFENEIDASYQCGMTQAAARVMWSKYKKEGII